MPIRTQPSEPHFPPSEPIHDASPAQEMARVLDQPPPLDHGVLRGDTLLTRRWAHGPLHDHLDEMSQHVVMTYYGAAQGIDWREGRERSSGRTRPGSITVIPTGHDGHWDIGGPLEVSHVYLTDQRLQSAAEALGHDQAVELVHRVAVDDPTAAQILTVLGSEAAAQEPSTRLFLEQAVDLLCTQLVRGHSSLGNLAAPEPRRGLADWQVRKVTAFMQAHLDRDIGLDELAELVQLSRFHFATAFRLATRQAPHAWLTELRITRARQLLARPELPVTEIALEVGYQTPSSFAAAFRKKTGLTPSQFRRGL